MHLKGCRCTFLSGGLQPSTLPISRLSIYLDYPCSGGSGPGASYNHLILQPSQQQFDTRMEVGR